MSDELQTADLLQAAAPTETNTSADLPGSRLKAEREARGMSVSEVAHSLKFSVRQIEALEANRLDALQGATFLRGFIRSYARYLKLDDAPLLALLEASAPPAQAEIVAPTNMGEAVSEAFVERNQKWLMLVMALVVVAAVGAYWLTINEKAGEGESLAKEETPAETLAQPAVVAPTPVAVPAPDAPAAVAASGTATAPATLAVAAAPAAPALPAPVPQTVVPPAAAKPATAAPAATVPAATPVAAKASDKQLTLDFDGRSWVEIKDANQKVVFTGEYGAGTHQVVSGKPPFQLWIGKASAVRVVYNEQKVNLQSHARDEVARLTLD